MFYFLFFLDDDIIISYCIGDNKKMNEDFSNRVTVLKALAILLVVSGHLEFSLLGMFTPYSFQLALFFLYFRISV